MIEHERGRIDYDETGDGPAVVLVPGSCSTGAAWRPVISQWKGSFRCVTTSLLGYGGTAERRTARDTDISHEAEIVEAVIRRAGRPVHLVGHSFGGLTAACRRTQTSRAIAQPDDRRGPCARDPAARRRDVRTIAHSAT